jgi:hypothetical protein
MRTKSVVSPFSFLSLFLALSLVLVVFQPACGLDELPIDAPPPWLRVGTYVEYRVDVASFPTGTQATLRWECIDLDGTVATLNVSHTATANIPYEAQISPGSAIIKVLTDSRDVVYSNGTVIGKTFLWVPPFLINDQKVVLEGEPPDEKIGVVDSDSGTCTWTCEGYQEIMLIRWGETGYNVTGGSILFDVNTGILVMGAPFPSAVIDALGAEDFITGASTIVATNVDLGPQFLRAFILFTIWNNLPIILPIIIFVTAFLLIRRKRKRQKEHKTRLHHLLNDSH